MADLPLASDPEVPDLRTWRLGRSRRRPQQRPSGSSADGPAGWTDDNALRSPAEFAPGVAALVAVSCVLVPILFGTAMYLLWSGMYAQRYDFIVVGIIPTLALITAMCLWQARKSAVSGWVRAAVAVPVLHIGLFAMVWFLWDHFSGRIEHALDKLPLIDSLPASQVALSLGALVLIGALLPKGRRSRGKVPRWLRATVAFALATVLLLGLWLPIAALGWDHLFETHHMHDGWFEIVAPRTAEFARIALAPPTIAALLFALVSSARPNWLRKAGSMAGWLLGAGVATAAICRLATDYEGYVAYANMVHVMLAAAVFCLMCVVALSIAHARVLFAARHDASRPAPWVQRGTIESADDAPGRGAPNAVDNGISDNDQVVGSLRYLGWLQGLSGRVRRFWLRTDQGLLEVPPNARMVAPMPLSSVSAGLGIEAHTGWSYTASGEVEWHSDVPQLRVGDEVVVSGYVEPHGDGVFRRHALPVPGPHGLVVTRARRPEETIWRDIQLIMWRPCVLYLMVVAAAAIPGIAVLLRM